MLISASAFAQSGKNFWTSASPKANATIVSNKTAIKSPRTYSLSIDGLLQAVASAPERFGTSRSNVIVAFPNADGTLENFRIMQFSNMEADLAARYPEIKSYVGQGIENPASTIYFSISPLGLQSMVINADRSAVFIEPFTSDNSNYVVYRKSDKAATLDRFECRLVASAQQDLTQAQLRPNADDGKLRNFRLAMSVTGEYTTYFGGTKALALAAINNSMTRVNGVFENDFGVHMNLISNTDAVIYTNASSDPYSVASTGAGGAWNQELQTTLTNVIGSANYDVGHLFGASGGGGNAGCIGCVCKDPTSSVPKGKGSGFTSPADGVPSGDNFDIDYVAHEMGHQFGGNHTFSHSNEGTIAQCEPGSGSTIMGYAGITGATTDVQAHSDPFFHAVTIQQITNYVKTTTCQTTTVTGNAVPTANAGLDYTVPKGTPFVLTGSGSDANGDAITYDWEQMDTRTTTNSVPSPTKTGGPAFRSFNPSTSPLRYFPRLETVKTGATSWTWESVPTVARTLNFRLTVRDNRAGGPANNSDDMIVTVNATAGPFAVTSPNTAVSYVGNSTQTVTWSVAGTTANGVNAANVDILLSTDGGNTYPVVLKSATANNGTASVTIPNTPGTQNRIMVKGTNHIFFDISNANFTITAGSTGGDTTAPSAPTSLVASATTETSTLLSWTASTDNVGVTGYDVYQNGAFKASTASTSMTVSGLSDSTTYTYYVKAKDAAGNISAQSNTVSVTTLTPASSGYCASQGNSIADERIGNVSFNTINNSSAATSGYTDYTAISTNVNRNTSYAISITPSWPGTIYNEGYAVFIDYNQDGDFDDAGETVFTNAATNATPVIGSISIPSTATLGATRMRVSMKYNGTPTSCETFPYGEVEDYTIVIGNVVADTTAPTAPTSLAASGTTQTTTTLSWNASSDNVGVTGYNVYQNGSLLGTIAGTSASITGLLASTTYAFTVKAYDAAGNISASSNTATVTTLSNAVSYCASQGNNVADEKIAKVVFGSINNSSTGGTGYTDFTSVSTSVNKGSAYTITITPQWTGTKYKEGYAVFIDYNGDGDFSDAGETVFTKAPSTTSPVSKSIIIPTTAMSGATRMRVSMKYNGIPTACETFSYGQVEDYTININGAARFADEVSNNELADVTIYPNPVVGNELYIMSEPNSTFRIINLLGQEISKGNIENGAVNVDRLPTGSYLITIENDGKSVTKKFIRK